MHQQLITLIPQVSRGKTSHFMKVMRIAGWAMAVRKRFASCLMRYVLLLPLTGCVHSSHKEVGSPRPCGSSTVGPTITLVASAVQLQKAYEGHVISKEDYTDLQRALTNALDTLALAGRVLDASGSLLGRVGNTPTSVKPSVRVTPDALSDAASTVRAAVFAVERAGREIEGCIPTSGGSATPVSERARLARIDALSDAHVGIQRELASLEVALRDDMDEAVRVHTEGLRAQLRRMGTPQR